MHQHVLTLMTWLSDLSASSADWTIRWPISLCNFPIAMASVVGHWASVRGKCCHCQTCQHTFSLNILYLWHPGILWWHCPGGSHTHQTSPICCSLPDLQILPHILGSKQTYSCIINSFFHNDIAVIAAQVVRLTVNFSKKPGVNQEAASPGHFLRSSISVSVRCTYGWRMDQSFLCHVRVGRTLRGNR